MPAFIVAIAALITGGFLATKGQAVVGLGLMFGMFVNAYTVNCTVAGHCNVWAWVLTVTYLLATAMVLGGQKFAPKK